MGRATGQDPSVRAAAVARRGHHNDDHNGNNADGDPADLLRQPIAPFALEVEALKQYGRRAAERDDAASDRLEIVGDLLDPFEGVLEGLTVAAAKAGDKGSSVKWFIATILLGAAFAILHLREWFHMFGEGWSLSNNPVGGPVMFGAVFFSITGLHLLHVISGVVALAIVAVGFKTNWLDANHVETTGLYWHFVDLVWMFVFPMLYLMNAAR